MEEAKLSKYARKKLRQQREAEREGRDRDCDRDRYLADLDLRLRVISGATPPPPPKAETKPKPPPPPPPPPRGLVNDLGTLPDEIADNLEAAAEHLRRAHELAAEALAASARGLQTAEPRALESMTLVAADKIASAAKRARRIPNKPQANENGGER